MKNFVVLALAVCSLVMLAGCADDDDSETNGAPQTARLRAAHFTTAVTTVDLWVDGSIVLENVGYGDVTSYVAVNAGTRVVQISAAGTNPPSVLFSENLNVPAATASTIAAAGSLFDLTVIAYDDDRHPDSTQAKLRFIHLSPDAPDVDMDAVGQPQLFASVDYTASTAYHLLPAGTYDVLIRQAGTSTLLLSQSDLPFEAGHNYTLFLIGSRSGGTLHAVVVVDV